MKTREQNGKRWKNKNCNRDNKNVSCETFAIYTDPHPQNWLQGGFYCKEKVEEVR